MKLLFTIILLFLLSNTAHAKWFFGTWKVDEAKTYEIIGEEHKTSFVGLTIAILKDQVIDIRSDKIQVSVADKTQDILYEIKTLEESSAILELADSPKDFELGRDIHGTYMIVRKTVKVDSDVTNSEAHHVYLKPL